MKVTISVKGKEGKTATLVGDPKDAKQTEERLAQFRREVEDLLGQLGERPKKRKARKQ